MIPKPFFFLQHRNYSSSDCLAHVRQIGVDTGSPDDYMMAIRLSWRAKGSLVTENNFAQKQIVLFRSGSAHRYRSLSDVVDHWALTPAALEICTAWKTIAYVASSTLSCERYQLIPCLPAMWISGGYGETTGDISYRGSQTLWNKVQTFSENTEVGS